MPITPIPAAAEAMPKFMINLADAIRRLAGRCRAASAAFRRNPDFEQLVLTKLEEEIFETHYRAQTAHDLVKHLISKSSGGEIYLSECDAEDLVAITKRVRRATCHLVNRCGLLTETRT